MGYSFLQGSLIGLVEGLERFLRGWRALLVKSGDHWRTRFLTALALRRNRRRHFKHELAVCAIFKNEALFLEEWLNVHFEFGVEHFYLYNNNSTDNFSEVIEPWIRRGVVTLIEWPDSGAIGLSGQTKAYNHCVKHFRMHAKWIGFIDIDEFLFSPETEDLRDIMNRYDGNAVVFVYWKLFGTNGHEKRPEGSVIENYTKCIGYEKARDTNRKAWKQDDSSVVQMTGDIINGKTIVNPRLIIHKGVHLAKPILGVIVDEFGNELKNKKQQFSYKVLRINHYWSKSKEDFIGKISRNEAFWDGNNIPTPKGAREDLRVVYNKNIDDWLDWEKQLNSCIDTTLFELRQKMIKRNMTNT
jgi:hypothetical protein